MLFSDHFRFIHSQLAPTCPIENFAQIAVPSALGMNSKKDFYAPIRFSIQVAKGQAGAIRMDVPVHANEKQWLPELHERLVGMLKLPKGAAHGVELRTVTGTSLKEVPTEKLNATGKLHLFVDGRRKLLDGIPIVPVEYSVTKRADIKSWFTEAKADLPDKIANVLHNKQDVYAIDEAIKNTESSETSKAIATHLRSSVANWNEFVRSRNISSPTTVDPKVTERALQAVTKHVLNYVRSHVGASKHAVTTHLACEMAKRQTDSLLLGDNVTDTLVSSSSSFHDLFHKLARDALASPTLESAVIEAIYAAPMGAEQPTTTLLSVNSPAAVARKMGRSSASHHPWNAQVHHTILAVKGSYPSDYLARHTRQDMSATAPYVGDVAKTYKAYHMFAGIHSVPPGLVIKAGIPQFAPPPLNVAAIMRERLVPKVIPISNGDLPRLIPIDCGHAPAPKDDDDDDEVSVPINCGHAPAPKDDDEDEEKSVESKMPPLIPIDVAAAMRSRLVRIQDDDEKMPPPIPIDVAAVMRSRLVRIQDDNDDNDGDIERHIHEVDEFPHLPSVADVFKK